MKISSAQAHSILQAVGAAIAGAAVVWPQLPVTWQQHVPGWVLGVLAVATMVLPSPVIRDPKTVIATTVPKPTDKQG
jgi:hypothetical protein